MQSKTNKNKVYSDSLAQEHISILQWILLGALYLFFIFAPFQKALFNGIVFTFERPIFSFLIFGFLTLLLLSVYLFSKWTVRDSRDLLTLFVWLIPLCYFISWFDAASHHYAKNMLYVNLAYAAIFVLGVSLGRSFKLSSILNRIVPATYALFI